VAEGSLSWPPDSGWLFSSKLPEWQKKIVREMQKRVPQREGMLWILSSGTSSIDEVKAVGISTAAVEASARSVNRHLRASSADRWLLTLPTYHVGGLGIVVRAKLSGSPVVHLTKWDAQSFAKAVASQKITLTSLVPTQVHDLVSAGLSAPPGLRAIVVGGGALDVALYSEARMLDWPVLPSYGLTECASQVATASLESLKGDSYPDFEILKHVEVETREGRVFLKASSLCRWVARMKKSGEFSLEDPLRDGWLATEDLAEVRGSSIRFLGRRDEIVKVLGELVAIPALEARARAFFGERGLKGQLVVLAVAGGRAGHRLVMVTDGTENMRSWSSSLKEFNRTLSGPERVQQMCWVNELPRGELGKIKKASLSSNLNL
jgi:O-succinylbenzoic acid--CoA ligase